LIPISAERPVVCIKLKISLFDMHMQGMLQPAGPKEVARDVAAEAEVKAGVRSRRLSSYAKNPEPLFEECNQRLNDLKQEAAAQQSQIADIARREIEAIKADIKSREAERPTISSESSVEMASLRAMVENYRTELGARMTSLQADWEQIPAGLKQSNVNTNAAEERYQLQVTQMQDLRRDLTSLQERTQLMVQSNEEVHQLHQVILQSANDLSSSIEEVSNATVATEKQLRHDLQAMKTALEASDSKIRAELMETLADEQEKRALEANILRTRLDAAYGRLEDLQAKATSGFDDSPTSARREQLESLRLLLDSTRNDLSNLEIAMSSQQADQMGIKNETRRHAEDLMSTLRTQVAEGLAEERRACLLDIEEVRRYFDDLVARNRQASGDGSGGTPQGNVGVTLADVASLRDLQDVRTELSTVKASLQVIDSECRRSTAAATRIEAEMLNLEGEARKSAAVLPRVEALEEVCRKQSAVGRKVETLETDIRQIPREAEFRRLEAEIRRTVHDVVPLASRIDAVEAEVRKANREVSPIHARLDLHESELQVVRERMALAENVDLVQGEVKEVAQGLINLKKGVENGTLLGSAQTVDASRIRYARPITPPRSNLPLPSLSDDLKNSIESLVHKVNKTLTIKEIQEASTAEPPSAENPGMQDEYLHALQAVQELRQRNLELREGNADIVEELLQNESMLTPGRRTGADSPPVAPPLAPPQAATRECSPRPQHLNCVHASSAPAARMRGRSGST